MINPDYRFWVAAAGVTHTKEGGLYAGEVVDWDQRRWITVKGSTKLLVPDEDVELEVLKRHIDQLSQTVHSITVDDEGLLVSVSSDPEDDSTLIPHYPRLSKIPSLQELPTMQLSVLKELARLGPKVDMVSYVDDSGEERKAIFKYSIVFQLMKQVWNELHLTKSLPKHPNLVQFDRIVLNGTEDRVIGFLTKYVPGGDLDQNPTRVFRLEWLKQLTTVLDFLNLELGIMHQDVATRNLLIDPETNNLVLFDFDRSAPIGQPGYRPERDDVKGTIFTLYEIITCDYHFREVPYDEQDPESVQALEEWPVNGKLDSDARLFREHLNEWARSRKALQEVAPEVQAKSLINIPAVPPPSPCIVGEDENGEPIIGADLVLRRVDALKHKQHAIIWDRPPSKKLRPELDTMQKNET